LSEGSAPAKNKLAHVKNELRGFTSLHGFSSVLNTSNPFVKGLWVFFILILISSLIQNSLENLNDYYQYTVITKIENVNENPMNLPAVTLCLAPLQTGTTNATLEGSLFICKIGEVNCDIRHFYSFEIKTGYTNSILPCYVLNGGKNSLGNFREIKTTKNTGQNSGFALEFFLPEDHLFLYYINDAFVQPISSEIIKTIIPGTYSDIILEKTIETKLEYPFNNCWDLINLPDTPLVRQFAEANITYRQVNCFEFCFQDYVQNYAIEHKISEAEAIENEEVKNYDKVKNCDHLCPLECESTQYRISESKFSLDDYSNSENYSLEKIPVVEKKLNVTVNSTEEFNKNYLAINVYFDSLKYTKISQTPKTSLSALVSNLGGSTGLFLDLSFMSACRAVEFFLGVIFKF